MSEDNQTLIDTEIWATAGKVRMTPRGEYSQNSAYKILDVVYYKYGAYIAKKSDVTVPPYNEGSDTLNNGWAKLVELPFGKEDYENLVQEYIEKLEFTYVGRHNTSNEYKQSNIVTNNNGDLYIALQNVGSNTELSNSIYWVKFFDGTNLTSIFNGRIDSITSSIDDVSSRVESIENIGISSALNDINSTISSMQEAIAGISSGVDAVNSNISEIQDTIGTETVNTTPGSGIKLNLQQINEYLTQLKQILPINQPNTDSLPVEAHTKYHNYLRNKNSFVYETYLGNKFTEEQRQAIDSGTFDNLYLGSFWYDEEAHKTWRIWGFDTFYGRGDQQLLLHHCIILPDELYLDNEVFDETGKRTSGQGLAIESGANWIQTAYSNSTIRARIHNINDEHLHVCRDVYRFFNINSEEGANNDSLSDNNYVFEHTEVMFNTIYGKYVAGITVDSTNTNNFSLKKEIKYIPSGMKEFRNCTIELPSEAMLCGILMTGPYDHNIYDDYPILPLAAQAPWNVACQDFRYDYWCRDVGESSENGPTFNLVYQHGHTSNMQPNRTYVGEIPNETPMAIRPYFLICGWTLQAQKAEKLRLQQEAL